MCRNRLYLICICKKCVFCADERIICLVPSLNCGKYVAIPKKNGTEYPRKQKLDEEKQAKDATEGRKKLHRW